MQNTPLVSVIITPKNAFTFIREAIRSVLSSSIKDVEVIVSPADNFDYKGLSMIFKDPRLVILPPDIGTFSRGPAKNKAMWRARGKYICTLDADDVWKPGWLEKMLPVAQEHGLAFSATEHFKVQEGKVLSKYPMDDKDLIDLLGYTTSHTTLFSLVSMDLTSMWPDCFGQDAIREMLVLAKYGKPAPLVKDAVYRVRIHPESESVGSKIIDSSYAKMQVILASDPNSLGVGQLDEDTLRELKFYFDYRRAVNTLYERNRRNKDYSYYEYVRDSKMNPAKLGMTR